jgi:tetratricopeptide (TPR) repeat protein
MTVDSKDNPNKTVPRLLSEGRFSEAIPHLEKLVTAESCDIQDAVHLACSYQQVGNYGAAINMFEQVVDSEALIPADRARLYERFGYSLLAAEDLGRAAIAFETANTLVGGSFRADIGLGLCMMKVGRPHDAHAFFAKALELNPNCADAYNNLGVLAWSQDSFEEAAAHFKRALEINPTHKDALPNMLTLMFELESYESAKLLLECYATADPENQDLLFQLAYCHIKLGRPDEARALLKKILNGDPGQENALALLAECESE